MGYLSVLSPRPAPFQSESHETQAGLELALADDNL